ncbi:MAG: DNA-directed RNA polymerase subunit B'', partial [Candidatus Aenigmarchaeota archaeon]|nr:DNA-directed RNA polymerase subunit B'' [Candidatus Aenigmarchaeota archaeon]
MKEDKLLKSFLSEKASHYELARHQIDSYNHFVRYGMTRILEEIGVQEINITEEEQIRLKLTNIRIGTPVVKEVDGSQRILTPLEARIRDITYQVPIYIDVIPYFGNRECISKQTELYQLPVMVNSDICILNKMTNEEKVKVGEDPFDSGGYFIINGTERVIVNFEHIAPNKLILKRKGNDVSLRIDSSHNGFTQKHSFEKTKKSIFVTRFSMFSKEPIAIVILIKILGIETDKDIIDAITTKEDE